jgi:hypothetical protein
MTTYNDATVMPIPPREDKSIHTKVDPNFVLPDVHPVFKNVTFRTPKLEKDLIDYNEKLKQRAREDFVPRTLGIRHGMLQLVEALALKRPLWSFTATDFSGTYGFVTEFVVRQGSEELGKIRHELDYTGRSVTRTDIYKLFNHRINEKLDRRDHKTTAKLDVAIRTVLKEFGVKNLTEVIASAKEAVTKTVKDFNLDAERKARDTQWNVRESLMDTLINEPDLFKQCSWYEKLGAPCVEHTHYANMMAVMKSDVENLVGGKLIIQRGDTYIVVDNVNNVSYTHQTLPHELRSKLGMLKLVEPDQLISGVGFKSNQECFFVFDHERAERQHNEE